MERSAYASARAMPVESRDSSIKSPAFSCRDQQAHMIVVARLLTGADVANRKNKEKASSP
jgi:hypothetical protein